MHSDSVVSTEHPPDLTDESLDIGINVDTNIDLNTIASIYLVVNVYTNDIVSISTASISITSIVATIAIMNPDLRYANQTYSLNKLQELESQMITIYSSGFPHSNVVLCLPIIPTIFLSCYHHNTLYLNKILLMI